MNFYFFQIKLFENFENLKSLKLNVSIIFLKIILFLKFINNSQEIFYIEK